MRRNMISMGILVVFIGITLYFNLQAKELPKEYRTEAGYLAPDFTISTMDGAQTISLSELKGKPVFVNFWASWCPPCRAEMPHILEAYKQYGDQIEFVMINAIEQEEHPNDGLVYAKNNQLTFPIYMDRKDIVSTQYGILAFPTSFFIDRNGVIDYKIVGSMSKDTIEKQMKELLH